MPPIKNQGGKDGTEYFDEAHSISFLNGFKVLGELEPPPPLKDFTKSELATHNNKKSLYVNINNRIYDLTTVLRWHPKGPDPLLLNGGKDASILFNAVHQKHYLGHSDPIGKLIGDSENID